MMPRMMMTTTNSIKVKPVCFFITFSFNSIQHRTRSMDANGSASRSHGDGNGCCRFGNQGLGVGKTAGLRRPRVAAREGRHVAVHADAETVGDELGVDRIEGVASGRD